MFILCQWRIQGRGPGVQGHPLFFAKNEAHRSWRLGPPLISGSGWLGPPPPSPLSEGLDSPLIFHNKVFLLVNFRDVANAFYLKIDESSYTTKT